MLSKADQAKMDKAGKWPMKCNDCGTVFEYRRQDKWLDQGGRVVCAAHK